MTHKLARLGALQFAVFCFLEHGSALEEARQLTSAEAEELLEQAAAIDRAPQISDAHIETSGDGSRWGEAYVDFLPTRTGIDSCIAGTVLFIGHSVAGTMDWDPWITSLEYTYWPSRADCSDRNPIGSIHLTSLVDSDSLVRIMGEASDILRRASEYVESRELSKSHLTEARRTAVLSGVGVKYYTDAKLFLYEMTFKVSGCHSVIAHVRLLERIEVVDAFDTVC